MDKNKSDNEVDKILVKYIKELNKNIRTEVKNVIKGDKNIYAFGDGCVRQEMADLYMSMLLSATLRHNLKNKNKYDSDNEGDVCGEKKYYEVPFGTQGCNEY